MCGGERWTLDQAAAADMGLQWIRGVEGEGLSQRTDRVHTGGNSGYQAIGLAYVHGAARVILLGFDMQRTGGAAHWHPDHPKHMGNLGDLAKWRARFDRYAEDLQRAGVEVINATRETALTAFPQQALRDALALPAPYVPPPPPPPPLRPGPVLLQGMLGLGDNVHQRAIVRELLRTREVWLETPWPAVYQDLGPGLHLLPVRTALRTQAANVRRERDRYDAGQAPRDAVQGRIWYSHDDVRRAGGFLGGMCRQFGIERPDFSLPIPPAWRAKADAWLAKWRPDRPLMLYRPLVERTEWSGCASRNPNHAAYHALASSVRRRFFVVSVADLQPGVEWIAGQPLAADVECHAGELDFETLAALASIAGLVYCSPGFLLVLAQAVGARLCAVFGGHESPRLYDHGHPRHLLIGPRRPCECFSKEHACDKAIDVQRAAQQLQEFVTDVTADHPAIAA